MQLKETWRWFGPQDPVRLKDILQTGASGVVTALHGVPHGEVWPLEKILKRKNIIEKAGLSWDVVESVTVHETIKTRTGNYKKYIEQYKQTLRNLASCNINIVTYNFMPVMDWTRTDLTYKMPDTSRALYFNWSQLALFDKYILKRKNADISYSETTLLRAEHLYKKYSASQIKKLTETITAGIPGEKKLTINDIRKKLELYKNTGHKELKENLQYFLQQICPLADELNIKMALHPDDPPYNILGLPRIVKNNDDINSVFSSVKNISNGMCFCTGSLGASPENNLVEMIQNYGDRIYFVHLRNTKRDEAGNFYEADHLAGDTNMYDVVNAILKIQQKKSSPIPFRPDHGHLMLDDKNKITNPGYSCIGRMRGLAELRGLQMGIYKTLYSNESLKK